MDVSEVYALIQDDLDAVHAGFEDIISARSDFAKTQDMLRQILVGGKVVRPTLVFLSGGIFNGDKELLRKMGIAVETMHIATLVHDDAIDSADLRRGRPTINSVYGVDCAVLLGDYLFATSGNYAASTGNIKLMQLFSKTLGTIAHGEIKQAFSSYVLNQTYEQYIDRMAGKTAALFQMSTISGAIISGASERDVEAMNLFGYNLGLAFQIIDDILDYTGSAHDVGKPVGADLRQGTLTLPAAKLLKLYPDNNPVVEIFNHRNVEENIIKAVDMVRNSSIIDECYKEANIYYQKACDAIEYLPSSPYKEALFGLSEFVLERNN